MPHPYSTVKARFGENSRKTRSEIFAVFLDKVFRLVLGKRGGIIPSLHIVTAARPDKCVLLLGLHTLANERKIKQVHQRDDALEQLFGAVFRIRVQIARERQKNRAQQKKVRTVYSTDLPLLCPTRFLTSLPPYVSKRTQRCCEYGYTISIVPLWLQFFNSFRQIQAKSLKNPNFPAILYKRQIKDR